MAKRTSGRLILEAKRSTGAIVVYIAVIVAGLAVAGIVASKLTFKSPFKSYDTVRAQFTDLKGIFPGGDSVRIHGVVVGIVTKATLVHGQPVATLAILKQYGPIYRNAQFRIRPVTPLDDLYIDVTSRGTKSAGVASSSDVIPVSQTVTPVDISRVLDTFNGDTRSRLTILLSELGKGLPDGGLELRSAFVQLVPFLKVTQQATDVIDQHQQYVKELVHNFGTLSAALQARQDALTGFIRSGESVTDETAGHSDALQSTLVALADLLPTVRSSFDDVRTLTGSLDPALQNLTPVTEHLKRGLEALGTLGTEAEPAIRALQPAFVALRPMARQLVPTSVSLKQAFTRLTAQAPQFNTLTEQLLPCLKPYDNGVKTIDPVRDFFNNTLSVLAYGDVNGSYPRANMVADLDTLGGEFGVKPAGGEQMPSCAGEF